MKRRSFLTASGLALGLIAFNKSRILGSTLWAQNYQFKPLRNNIGIFIEQGGTIGWLDSADGFIVVDAQFPTSAQHVIEELQKLGSKPFISLINTHHHSDHTAGNIVFKEYVNKVVAHTNSHLNQKAVAEKQGNENEQYYPNIMFTASWNLETSDEYIKAYHYGPAHTNGDSIVHFENANIVHMGDLVFNRRFPYIDKTAGANIHNWIETLQKVMDNFDNDTLFIFGHSLDPNKVTGTKSDLKAFRNYLIALLNEVYKRVKAKQSLEQILKIHTIPGAPEWQGVGIERSLTAAYEELTT